MVWNKLCFGANNAVGLSKQRKIWPALYKFLCFVSATALHVFASQHNFFRTTWPDCAKGLLPTFHYYLRITSWTLVYCQCTRDISHSDITYCVIGFTVKCRSLFQSLLRGDVHVIVNCYYYLSLMHSTRREPKARNTCSPL